MRIADRIWTLLNNPGDCLTVLLIAILPLGLVSCGPESDLNDEALPALYPAPKVVPLNTLEPYAYNSFLGKPVNPVINSNGDTVKTGIPIAVEGRVMDPSLVDKARVRKAGEPSTVYVNPRSPGIRPEPKTVFIPGTAKSKIIADAELSNFTLTNSTGDTIQTGVPLKITGRSSPCFQPLPQATLRPGLKDRVKIDLKYFDLRHGMNSNYVLNIVQDSKGNLWFGTLDGGASMFNGSSFRHYTEKEGLGSNRVNAVLEDSQGMLWFGTQGGGVIKFDGDSFVHFTEKEGLSSDDILTIFQDSRGDLWFGTNNRGVIKYDGETVTHFAVREGISTIIRGIEEDRNGDLWFSSYTAGVFRYDGENFTPYGKEDGLGDNCVMPILEDREGNMWFGTWGGGISKFDGEQFTRYTESDGLCNNYINAIVEDHEGILWFGTWEGLSRFDGETFTNITEEEGLSYNDVHSLIVDDQGNLWMGTWGGGINIYNPRSFRFMTEEDGLSDDHVFSMIEDRDGLMWLGSWGGVSSYDGTTVRTFTTDQGLNHNYVISILQDSRGEYWFGTDGGGVSRFDGSDFTSYLQEEGLKSNHVNCIIEDRNGHIWFGTREGGVIRFDGSRMVQFSENEGLIHNDVRDILEDSKGNLWFGSARGLTKFDGSTFTHITESEGLSNNEINSIFEDRESLLWIGTNGGGVNVFDGNSFTYISTREGLSHNSVNSILEDGEGAVWISTNMGINRLKTGSPIQNFGDLDGLAALDFYRNSTLLDSQNHMLWGGNQNLTIMDLNAFQAPEKIPAVTLDYLEIRDQFIDFRNPADLKDLVVNYDGVEAFMNYPLNLVVPYTSNELTFHFSGIDWAAPDKLRYSYRLDGLNDHWSQPQSENYVEYHSVPEGTYTFHLRAIGVAGLWSEPFHYRFTVLPPWWKTIAFRVLFMLVIVILLILLSYWRTSSIRKRKSELEALNRRLKKEIESKNLTNEELKVAKEKAEESDRLKSAFLASMSHEIRTPLNVIVGFSSVIAERSRDPEFKPFVSQIMLQNNLLLKIIEDLIDMAKVESGGYKIVNSVFDLRGLFSELYHMFKGKYTTGVTLHLDIGSGPLLVRSDRFRIKQVLVNLLSNAIKFTKSGSIRFGYKTDHRALIRIFVNDTGIGIPEEQKDAVFERFIKLDQFSQGTGLGLSIVKQLVELLGSHISLETETGVGSRFSFTLPYQPEIQTRSTDLTDPSTPGEKASELEGYELTILVVEDDESNYLYIKELLDNSYNTIIHAENGKDAVDICQANPEIDIVLMDLMLPVMDGFEATKRIKEINPGLPVIVLTAYTLEKKRKDSFRGWDAFILKPFDKETLFREMKRCLEK